MREELPHHPVSPTSHWLIYAAMLSSLKYGEYLRPSRTGIKEYFRFCIDFDQKLTTRQIAYSNDRYRRMWQVLDNCFFIPPIQTLRWFRSEENEINIVYVRLATEKHTCKTYDSAMFYALGITVKSPTIPTTSIDNAKVALGYDMIRVWNEYHKFMARDKTTLPSEDLDKLEKSSKDALDLELEQMRGYTVGIDPVTPDSKPTVFSGKGISENLSNSLQSEFEQDVEKMKEYYAQAQLRKEKSTLSDQDLEDLTIDKLADSEITFGLTKDNIAHIESSLSAKDWDATYAHYFWVQMGKDCNWEPLTLALHYFRYRDGKGISADMKKFDTFENKQTIKIDLLEEFKKPITEGWLVSKGFKMEGYNDELERTKIYIRQYMIVHSHRAFGFVVAAKDKEGNIANASWHNVAFQFEIEQFYSEFARGEKL